MHSSSSMLDAKVLGDSGALIAPGLYLGDRRLASNLDALQQLGITHVVNATIDIRNYYAEARVQGQMQLVYLRCGVHDTEQADLSSHFAPSCDFITGALAQGHAVLVHCQQGVSRSTTLCIAWLMRERKMGLAEAYTLVRRVRPQAKPKANFLRQLMKWGTQLAPSAQAQGSPQSGANAAAASPSSTHSTAAAAASPVPAAAPAPAAAPSAAAPTPAAAPPPPHHSSPHGAIGATSASPAGPAPAAAVQHSLSASFPSPHSVSFGASPSSSSSASSPAQQDPHHSSSHPMRLVEVAPGLQLVSEGAPEEHNPVDEQVAQQRAQIAEEKQLQRRRSFSAAASPPGHISSASASPVTGAATSASPAVLAAARTASIAAQPLSSSAASSCSPQRPMMRADAKRKQHSSGDEAPSRASPTAASTEGVAVLSLASPVVPAAPRASSTAAAMDETNSLAVEDGEGSVNYLSPTLSERELERASNAQKRRRIVSQAEEIGALMANEAAVAAAAAAAADNGSSQRLTAEALAQLPPPLPHPSAPHADEALTPDTSECNPAVEALRQQQQQQLKQRLQQAQLKQ